jgi:hypothetical protein
MTLACRQYILRLRVPIVLAITILIRFFLTHNMLIKDEVQPSNVDGKKGATNRRDSLSPFWYVGQLMQL